MELQALLPNSIFVGLICLSSCLPENKEYVRFVNREHVTTKSIDGKIRVNDSLFSGVLFSITENGNDTLQFTSYLNGREHGLMFQRYPNGTLESKRYYRDGVKVGKLLAWWDNGNKRLEYEFENGEYHGEGKEWAPNGTLVRKQNFRNGYEEGLQQLWTASGELWANYEVRNGRHYGITGVKSCATLWKDDSVSSH